MIEAESEQIPQVSLKTHRYSLEPRLLTFNLNVKKYMFKGSLATKHARCEQS